MPHHETLSFEQLTALKAIADEYIEKHNIIQGKYVMRKIDEVLQELYEDSASCPTHVHMHPSVADALGLFLGDQQGQVIKQIETDSGSMEVVVDKLVQPDELRFIEQKVIYTYDEAVIWKGEPHV